MQEVRDEATATKEQLDSYKESCSRLQEDLQVCDCLRVFILHESIPIVWCGLTNMCFSF